jgi:exosortase A
MVLTWYESNSFNHCFLILPIAAYLAWRRRSELAAADISPDWRGVVAIAVGALAWLVGDTTGTLIVQEVSLVFIVQALILTIYGKSVFRILLFPLAYLYFTVPFGLELVPPLQAATAFLSIALLKLVGVPLFSDGYLISIPNGNWYIADACSGVRYVIASLALGALFAGTMYVTWWRRVLVMVVAIVVPILANGIRAFGIILLAYVTDNELATGVDHIIYGWLFFTLVSFVVLAVGMSFREAMPIPNIGSTKTKLASAGLLPNLSAAVAVLLLIGAAKAYADFIDRIGDERSIHFAAPDIPGYDRVTAQIDDERFPRFDGADAVIDSAYQASDQTLYLRIGYYRSERRNAQAVSPNHELYGNPEMLIVGKGSIPAQIGSDPVSVRYQRISWVNHGRIIWYWYWVDGRITGDAYFAKLLEAKAKLLGGVQQAAIIALAADYRSDPEEAVGLLRDFALKATNLKSALKMAQTP